jgi:hypothetical protein
LQEKLIKLRILWYELVLYVNSNRIPLKLRNEDVKKITFGWRDQVREDTQKKGGTELTQKWSDCGRTEKNREGRDDQPWWKYELKYWSSPFKMS